MQACDRGRRRGGVAEPCSMMSSHTDSSWRIGSGRSWVLAWNRRTAGGSMSSSIPAAVMTSATVAAECLILVSCSTSLRRVAAPGGSWGPSITRVTPCTRSALDSDQPNRWACSRGQLLERGFQPRVRGWWESLAQAGFEVAGAVEEHQLLVVDRAQHGHVWRDGLLAVGDLPGAGREVPHAGQEQLMTVFDRVAIGDTAGPLAGQFALDGPDNGLRCARCTTSCSTEGCWVWTSTCTFTCRPRTPRVPAPGGPSTTCTAPRSRLALVPRCRRPST